MDIYVYLVNSIGNVYLGNYLRIYWPTSSNIYSDLFSCVLKSYRTRVNCFSCNSSTVVVASSGNEVMKCSLGAYLPSSCTSLLEAGWPPTVSMPKTRNVSMYL